MSDMAGKAARVAVERSGSCRDTTRCGTKQGAPDDVRESIVTRTILSPSNNELRTFLSKERSDSRVILDYIMEEYERAVIKANKYDPPPQTVATVEHVLPQNLTADWGKLFTADEHE